MKTIRQYWRAATRVAGVFKRHLHPWNLALEVATAIAIGVCMAGFIQMVVGEEFATRGYARVYAPFAGWLHGDGQRDQTTVMLIDDAALSDAGQTWPAQYSYHARLAKALARYRPRAVFFDIYFNQVRNDPSLPVLVDALCALRQQGTQVFLGAVPDAEGHDHLRPELEALAGKCFDKVGLQYTPDSLDRLAWNYPLREAPEESGDAEEAELPSAALAIYERAYGGHLRDGVGELALTWGSSTARHGVRWVEERRGHAGGEAPARMYCRQEFGWHWLEAVVPVGIKDFKDSFTGGRGRPLCVFHETLYAGDLSAGSEEEEAALRRLLQGRTVMIGAALANSGDRVLSPLHGRIPGVYLHAMALDNLLTYGDAYPREVHLALTLDGAHLRFYIFLLGSVLLGTLGHRLYKILRERNKTLAERHHSRGWRALGGEAKAKLIKLAGLAVAVWIAIYVGQKFVHIGLMTIVDVVFFSLAAEWLELNEKVLKFFGHPRTEQGASPCRCKKKKQDEQAD